MQQVFGEGSKFESWGSVSTVHFAVTEAAFVPLTSCLPKLNNACVHGGGLLKSNVEDTGLYSMWPWWWQAPRRKTSSSNYRIQIFSDQM